MFGREGVSEVNMEAFMRKKLNIFISLAVSAIITGLAVTAPKVFGIFEWVSMIPFAAVLFAAVLFLAVVFAVVDADAFVVPVLGAAFFTVAVVSASAVFLVAGKRCTSVI